MSWKWQHTFPKVLGLITVLTSKSTFVSYILFIFWYRQSLLQCKTALSHVHLLSLCQSFSFLQMAYVDPVPTNSYSTLCQPVHMTYKNCIVYCIKVINMQRYRKCNAHKKNHLLSIKQEQYTDNGQIAMTKT